MISVFGFFLVIFPLVFFHELGHFFFAKLFKVRVDAFSIGFGPVIFSKQFGETKFRWSLFPMGGYVKMLGEEPGVVLSEEEKKRSLNALVPWKKFFVFFGGPLFNLILAFFCFFALFVLGENEVSSKIGRVDRESLAFQSGLRSGDLVLNVDGVPVQTYREFERELETKKLDTEVKLSVRRNDEIFEVRVLTQLTPSYDDFGKAIQKVGVDGVSPYPVPSGIGVPYNESWAFLSGLRTRDQVIKINSVTIESFEEIVHALSLVKGKKIEIELLRGSDQVKRTIEVIVPEFSDPEELGLYYSEYFVSKVIEGSPAEKSGLKEEDFIETLNGSRVYSFQKIREEIQNAGKNAKTLEFGIVRKNEKINVSILPELSEVEGIAGSEKRFTIGFYPLLFFANPEFVLVKKPNGFEMFTSSFQRLKDIFYKNFQAVGRLVSGQMSIKTLGGPVMIGKVAGFSLQEGIRTFLNTLAVLSVGLGFLNLLPVPVLDGGHILLLFVEVVRRKPLSEKQLMFVQKVGLTVVLLLTFVVLSNDLGRIDWGK